MSWDEAVQRANASKRRVFGRQVQYEQPPAAAFAVTGIYGRPQNLEGLDPRHRVLWVQLSDFSQAPAAGNVVTDGAVVYDVVAAHPDGGAGVYLILSAR